MKNLYFHTIKLPFDAEVDEIFLNVIYGTGTEDTLKSLTQQILRQSLHCKDFGINNYNHMSCLFFIIVLQQILHPSGDGWPCRPSQPTVIAPKACTNLII